MIKLAVAGAAGRMGRTILTLALRDKEYKIVGGLESRDNALLGNDIGQLIGSEPLGVSISHSPEAVLKEADVLIDFTHPSAMEAHLKACLKSKTAYVLGTTGLQDKHLAALKATSKSIAIVQSPNMSVGVNLLLKLAAMTAKALDESYDIEVVEAHHRMKKDSPSGTALKLLEVLTESRKRDIKKNTVYGREGETGARPRGEIGVLAVRGGDVVGDHTVYFLGDGERIELTHKASSREAFAKGSLKAGKFVATRKAGLYNMLDVLGIA
jgi:4-hydroxy-tetrahydrodipicolinate reductase